MNKKVITCVKIAIFPYLLHVNAGRVTPDLKGQGNKSINIYGEYI